MPIRTLKPDGRSKGAQVYRAWYKTARWRALRRQVLSEYPLCVMCQQEGRIKAAAIVDHRKAHKGNAALFWDRDNLQGLCKLHHDSTKQSEERTGRAKPPIGVDGWPMA